jgi:MFS family permease
MTLAGNGQTPAQSKQLVLFVSVALLINYVDRGNLATAGPLLQEELGLTGTQLGVLLSAFYYTYVLAMVPMGWLTERWGAHRVLAAGIAIWSLATFLTGFALGFWTILLLRLLLGVGESAGFPSASQLFASRLKPAQIDMANGVLGFSYLVGPAIGTLLGGLLMPIIGWRAVFVLFGVVSLMWMWPILRLGRSEPKQPAAASIAAYSPSFGDMMRQRGLWGASLGHFSGNYNFYFILAWLPVYLIKERDFSMQAMAVVAGSAYLINALSALFAGWAVSRWTQSGRSASVLYKSLMALNHVGSMGCMIGMVLLPTAGSIACLWVFQVIVGLASPAYYAIPQIMAGPAAAGRWVGIQNACGNLAGIVAPTITGVLLDATGRFSSAFVLASALNILGLIGWVWMLPRVAPIDWQRNSSSGSAPLEAMQVRTEA